MFAIAYLAAFSDININKMYFLQNNKCTVMTFLQSKIVKWDPNSPVKDQNVIFEKVFSLLRSYLATKYPQSSWFNVNNIKLIFKIAKNHHLWYLFYPSIHTQLYNIGRLILFLISKNITHFWCRLLIKITVVVNYFPFAVDK